MQLCSLRITITGRIEIDTRSGLVDSLANPGGNLTGLTRFTRELSGKRLEVLKEIVPKVSRVGVLEAASAGPTLYFKDYELAARALKIQLERLEVRGPNPELEGAFQRDDQEAGGRAHYGEETRFL